MIKNILILGASGTVGTTIFRQLSHCANMKVFGTYFSAKPEGSSSMLHFSLESTNDICSMLEQVHPDIVVSALRGDFEKQLIAHEIIAGYLTIHCGKLIYLSTANVFDGSLEQPHYELDNRIARSDYGKFKIRCEDLLQNRMGSRVVLLRLPFVWGKDSPRMQAVKAGCEAGELKVYADLLSNHVSDMQIADLVQWIIQEDKDGVFHVGNEDVIGYRNFIEQLIAAMGVKEPQFLFQEFSGNMAVLSKRTDVLNRLKWDSERLIRYLCDGC